MNKELQAETTVDSSTTAELLPSANLGQNPMLVAANYNSTEKGNELIAAFMGLHYHKSGWVDISHIDGNYECTELKYSYAWDWLMPVIEKIENKWIDGAKSICKIEGDKVQIYHIVGYNNTDFATNYGYNGEKYDKITKVFLSVVDFVKWYNQKEVSEGCS